MADVNAEIGVNIDTSAAFAQLKSLQREIARFHTSVARSSEAAGLAQRDLQRNFINGVNAIQGFSAELRTVRTTAENFTNSLERNKFSMREYFRYAGASTKTFGRSFTAEFDTINKVAIENVKRLQTQYIKMGRDANGAMRAIAIMPTQLDMSNITTQTQLAAQRQAIFNQLVKQGSTNLLNFGKNTQWAGRQLMVGFTIPLIGLGSVAARTFMDMETAAIKFRKVYGDLFTPAEETQAALDSIQQLGDQFTAYGIAVADTVSLAADAAAAGFSGVDLQRQVTEATRLQVLGQIDQQKALETTISLQNAFRMSSADLADSINFLNAVENQTVVSLDDITTAIPKAAPIVRELGGDVKDLAFFMAAMKEGGINASEGANALKSGLASLINPTDKAKGMLMDMGINIDRIVESNVGNLKATVIEFAQALDGLTNLQRQRAIEQLFGKFQQARLSALFDNVIRDGNQAARVLDLASASSADLASTAEKELGITADSAMNKFRASVERVKVSLAPVGEVFLQTITPLLDKLNSLINWFNGLSDTSKKVLTKVALYLGGLAPVILMTVGLMANFIANGIKGLMLLRNGFLRLTGQSQILGEQTNFLTLEQQNAVAAAASLEQSHMQLQQVFTGETAALKQLIAEYQRMISAQNTAAARFPGMMAPGFRARGYANGIVSVPGPKGAGDIIPAMVSPGEAIIPTAMNKKYAPLVQGIIADNIPGFIKGTPGKPSLTGGQSYELSGLGIMAPGNTAFSRLGMDPAFFESGALADRIVAALSGGSYTLGRMRGLETRTTRSIAMKQEYVTDLRQYADEITTTLRKSAENLGGVQNATVSMSKILEASKDDLTNIFDRMTAAGGKTALAAEAMQKHGLYPTMGELGGRLGEVRAPSIRMGDKASDVSFRRAQRSPFQAPVRTFTSFVAGGSLPPGESYAHLNEQRRLGAMLPFTGRATIPGVVPAEELKRMQGALLAKGALAAAAYSPTEMRPATRLAATGRADAAAYGSAIEAGTQDIYVQARDRRSPHPLASKDGRDDAMAYSTAAKAQLAASGGGPRAAAGLINPRTGKPFTATELTNMKRSGQTTFLGMPGISESAEKGKVGKRFARVPGGGMGAGLGLLGANMAIGMAPSFPGQGIAQGALTGATLGMLFGPQGIAAGAGIGAAIAGISALIEKEKQHAEMVRATFTASADMIGIFGQKVLDTSLKITTFTTETKKAVDLFGVLTPEIQAYVDAINKLPEDNPVTKLVANISNPDMRPLSVAGNILTQVTDAIATGGLDPSLAENYVKAILAAANRTKDFAFVWDIVKKSVGNATEATTKNLDKLTDAVEKNNDTWYINTGTTGIEAYKAYNQLSGVQKILSDQMLKLFSITSNGTLKFNELMQRINGVRNSAINTKAGVIALGAAINASGNTDAIDRFNRIQEIFKQAGEEAKQTAADFLLFNTVLQTISEEGLAKWANENIILGDKFTGVGPSLADIIRRYSKSKDFKDALEVINQITNPETPTVGGGGGGDGKKKFLDLYDKELKALNNKRDALKNVNDELDRQNQYQMKQMDLMNQMTTAKISGNYLQAAQLRQQTMFEGASFARESMDVQLKNIISKVQNRRDVVNETGKVGKKDRSLLKKLQSKNYGDIVPMPKTPTVGFGSGTIGFGGSTATIGGDNYSITMNISGENSDEIVNKIFTELERRKKKNNKTNKVGK